jgi:protein-disulfide isomerase
VARVCRHGSDEDFLMASNRQKGRPSASAGNPPASRRSNRQRRLAEEAARARARDEARSARGGSRRTLYLAGGAVAAVVVIAVVGLLLLSGGGGANNGGTLPPPNAPGASQMPADTIAQNGRTLGDPSAPHTIDIYEDFQCTNCYSFAHDFQGQVIATYVATGQAKLVQHNWVTVSGGAGDTESLDAANAAMCAADQGKFWPYRQWLFTNQYSPGSGTFSKDRLKEIAQMMGGLDTSKFDQCVDGGQHDSEIQSEKLTVPAGATAPPALTIDGGAVLTSYDFATISAAMNTILGITPSPAVSASAGASAGTSASPGSSASSAASAAASPGASASPSASAVASPSAS